MGFATLGNELYTGRRSFDFIARRKLWYTIALAMTGLSLLAVLVLRLNPGIEFRGGSEFRVPTQSQQGAELTGQRAVASVVPNTEARVSTVGRNAVRVQTEKLTDRQTDQVKAALAKAYGVSETDITSSFVGATWGNDVSRKALQGLVVFLVLVGGVISAYFRTWKMAIAALVALLHDLAITLGVYALVGFEVTPATVIGFLTILGYSLYDTVVVFDKVRENTEHVTGSSRRTYSEAANLAVNQTLVRSINTSVVALLPVASILFIGAFLLGAGTLKDISLALFVGIAAGTYSSIFVATPLLVDLRRREPAIAAHTERLLKRRAEALARDSEVGAVGGREPVVAGAAAAYGSPSGRPAGRAGSEVGGSEQDGPGGGPGTGAGSGQRWQPRKGSRNRPGGTAR